MLSVRKNKLFKRKRSKLLKKAAEYMKSDSYMFAPLVSSSLQTYPIHKDFGGLSFPASNAQIEVKALKLREYLKSDSYMYASIIGSGCSNFSTVKIADFSPSWRFEFIKAAFTRKVTVEQNEQDGMKCLGEEIGRSRSRLTERISFSSLPERMRHIVTEVASHNH